MLEGRRLILTGITHTAALLIGLGGWMTLRHFQTTGPALPVENMGASRPRQDATKSLDEVLAVISADNANSPEKKWEKTKAANQAEFEELIKNMPVPDDLEAALSAEIASLPPDFSLPTARSGALMYFWAMKDLPGLLKWSEGRFDTPRTAAWIYYKRSIVAKILKEKGPDDLLAILGNPSLADNLRETVAGTMAESTDLGQLAQLKEKTDSKDWKKLGDSLCRNWPWNEKSKFVEFATSENNPQWLVKLALAQNDRSEAGAWLVELMKDGSLDPGFRDRLSQQEDLKYVALASPNLSLADRLQMMNAANPDQVESLPLADQFARRDVGHVFSDVRDWNAEFRAGSANANDVLAGVLKELPELAAKSPAELRNAVFLNLVEDDPVRALPLLDGLSAADRMAAMANASQNAFFRADPDLFLTFLHQMPADDPQSYEARLQAWEKHAPDSFQQQNMDYVKWVRALPDGEDREMAIYSLSMAAAEDDPELAAQLRSELKDENLRNKAQ